MGNDLKIIKKKYGEKMMHLCRKLFPTILEEDGALSKILLDNFEVSRDLYNDIIQQCQVNNFKNLIYKIYLGEEKEIDVKNDKTPKEIFEELGYDFYECKSLDEIMSFKKYYAYAEELCTFSENRLSRNYVFWVVKKDVDGIKREDFKDPKREDEYGTSVMSIQFTRDDSHTLSIKNRYNHTVRNPDNTFRNNLDNIYPGLTYAFERCYGLKQSFKANNTFELENYVKASDGKYYRYNFECSNVYYCGNNTIIDNFKVKKYEPEKFIIMDCYVLDLVNKTLTLYDDRLYDSFVDTVSNIVNIDIRRDGMVKEINLYLEDGSSYLIKLDSNNNIIELYNDYIEKVDDYFLTFNKGLKYISLPNTSEIGHCFLWCNEKLEGFNLDNVALINNYFLPRNECLENVSLPSVIQIGSDFITSNRIIKSIDMPTLLIIRDKFLYCNEELEEVNLNEVFTIGDDFISQNKKLNNISLGNVLDIGKNFMYSNEELLFLDLPNLNKHGKNFLNNNSQVVLNMPLISHEESKGVVLR